MPDEIVERLERLAAWANTSVSAVAVRELAEATRRADNPALLGALPDLDVDTASVIDLDAERSGRRLSSMRRRLCLTTAGPGR